LGAAVIDGFEGVGAGLVSEAQPWHPCRHRIDDFISTDRVGAEVMGVDPSWLG